MIRQRAAIVLAIAIVFPSTAFGHGGGLDSNGCHTNRKTGEYHCHRSSTPPPSSSPTRSPQTSTSPIRPASAQTLVATEDAETRDRHMVRTAQVLLRALGYRPSLLGSLDERTKVAVREFQRAESLDADGRISAYLILRLAEKVATKCE